MAHGFMGKMLWVDLSKKELKDEALDEKLGRDFLGGYGLGARILFSRQKAGVDPLGPDAILGLTTGVLTGTDALGGSRYIMVGKSPLTGTWGDANSGGNVGPHLKFAGYDAVFFTGIADKPVYLYIDNGKAELRDAAHLWGKDSFETEDILKKELGKDVEVACVGPSGEKLSIISAVMNNKGTSGLFNMSCESDDAPCKNWGGTAVIDFPNYADISGEPVVAKQERKYGCWRCPVACGGIMKASTGEHKYEAGAHKPEYETLAMLGSNLLNNHLESIIKANDICNRYGLDTISVGACIAFAIECYENGIITKKDTDGLEMTWGNHRSIIAMLEKLAKREGFGDILADGVKKAAQKIGKGAEKYAMHIGGQEIPAHDSRGGPAFAIAYGGEPTPARHTQGGEGPFPEGAMPEFDHSSYKGRGEPHKYGSDFCQIYNAAGICMIAFGDAYGHADFLVEALQTITGWDITRDELQKTGERIDNMRQAFNVREGLKSPWQYPDRMLGRPPKTEGPRTGITMTEDDLYSEYYAARDWDRKTGKPSKAKLLELGLDDVAKVLYG